LSCLRVGSLPSREKKTKRRRTIYNGGWQRRELDEADGERSILFFGEGEPENRLHGRLWLELAHLFVQILLSLGPCGENLFSQRGRTEVIIVFINVWAPEPVKMVLCPALRSLRKRYSLIVEVLEKGHGLYKFRVARIKCRLVG
jgi:hypothetical protein